MLYVLYCPAEGHGCVCKPPIPPAVKIEKDLSPTFWPYSQGHMMSVKHKQAFDELAVFKVYKRRSKAWVQHLWNCQNGVVIKNTHVKNESPIPYGKKVMGNVKLFQMKVKTRSQYKYHIPYSGNFSLGSYFRDFADCIRSRENKNRNNLFQQKI